MKAGWQTKKLGEVVSIEKKRHQAEKPLPYVGMEDIASNSGLFLGSLAPKSVKGGSFSFNGRHVLYGRLRPYLNKVLLPDFEGHCSTEVFPITPNDDLDRRFLFFWLTHPSTMQMIDATCTGARMPRANMHDVLEFDFSYPSLPEQQRIVAILDEAFEGIATAAANAEKNLANARELFQSALQSFIAQSSKGAAERRLGDESLLEIIDGDRGANYPKATDFHGSGHCLFLNTKNVRPDGFNFDSTMFISAEKDKQLRKGKLRRDDVVMTTRGTIGNIGLYSEDIPFDHIRLNSGMLIFRPNKHSLLPSFLFELLRSEIVRTQIRKHVSGAAQPQLPIKTLVNFTIPVPTDTNVQRDLVSKLRAFQPETQRLEAIYQQKLTALDELKKSILHQAFSGQLH